MNINPLVSCVIPSYKRADSLERAINSALNQTYKNIEVLVVDDNIAGDEYSIALQEIVAKYTKNTRVRLISQPRHINGAEARNAGIKAASGEWVAFLDDDDEWLPQKIEKQINALQADPKAMGASCYYHEFIRGKKVHSCPPYSTENLNYKIFTRQIAMYTPTLIMRKDKLMEFGGFDNTLKRHQDLQLLVEFTFRNKMTLVEDFLVNVYGDSLINRPSLESFIEVKKNYFNSVDKVFKSYSKHERTLIKCAHYYEVVFCAIKVRNYGAALKYIVKAGFHLSAIKMLAQRFKDKKFIA